MRRRTTAPTIGLLAAFLTACGGNPPTVTMTGDAGPPDVPSFVPQWSAAWCAGAGREEAMREATCPTDWASRMTAYPDVACVDGGSFFTLEQCIAVLPGDMRVPFFLTCPNLSTVVQTCPRRLVGTCVQRIISRAYLTDMMRTAYLYGRCW